MTRAESEREESDRAAGRTERLLGLLAASIASPSPPGTSPCMPSPAPPRAHRASIPTSASTSAAPAARLAPGSPGSTPGTGPALPSAWGNVADLLRDQAPTLGVRAPLNTGLLAQPATDLSPDLSVIWTLPAEPGRSAVSFAVRRLDAKGRLSVPVALARAERIDLPAERAGAVLTLFLPGTTHRPRAGQTVAPLALDHRGRLGVPSAARTDLGWASGLDVLVSYDPEQALLHLCPTWAVAAQIAGALDDLRHSARTGSSPVGPPAAGPSTDRAAS